MFFNNFFNSFNPFSTYSYRQPRSQPSFRDDNHSIILRNIQNNEDNYICFDCKAEMTELNYFDVINGIFICSNCAQEHNKLSKDISRPMTGNISSLEENDLMLFYYGGNKNLTEFIKLNYPLLENMKIKNKYSTKAMDYYRKKLRAKIFYEPEPDKPSKKVGYTSIYHEKENDGKRNNEERDNENVIVEPAVVSKGAEKENVVENAGMQVEGEENLPEKNVKMKKNKNSEQKIKYKKVDVKSNKDKEIKIQVKTKYITINQMGELSYYPSAMEIDGMDCEELI